MTLACGRPDLIYQRTSSLLSSQLSYTIVWEAHTKITTVTTPCSGNEALGELHTDTSRHKDLLMGRPKMSPGGYRPSTGANSAMCKGSPHVFPPAARSKQTTPQAAHDSREGQDPITARSPGPCQAAPLALPCTRTEWPVHPPAAPRGAGSPCPRAGAV